VRLSRFGLVALLIVGVGLLVVLAVGSLGIGAASLSFEGVIAALVDPAGASKAARTIVFDVRMPRIAGAVLVGGTLATVGCSLQAVMKNPLAEPYILGISSGSSVGAAVAVVLGAAPLGGGITSLAAFGTALISVAIVYRVAAIGGHVPPVRLLLAGVALSSFASAVTSFILYLTPEATEVRGVVFWLLGGLHSAEWPGVFWCAVLALPAVLALLLSSRWQNLLLLGDEAALSLGLDVGMTRRALIVIAALGTAAIVAFAGAIGFVGLIVPHALRPFTGPDHRRLVPASFIYGATLLLGMDSLARIVIAPQELPVGILTGLLGAPFFIGLLARQREGSLDA
jgi:iron complex transport system permease protein